MSHHRTTPALANVSTPNLHRFAQGPGSPANEEEALISALHLANAAKQQPEGSEEKARLKALDLSPLQSVLYRNPRTWNQVQKRMDISVPQLFLKLHQAGHPQALPMLENTLQGNFRIAYHLPLNEEAAQKLILGMDWKALQPQGRQDFGQLAFLVWANDIPGLRATPLQATIQAKAREVLLRTDLEPFRLDLRACLEDKNRMVFSYLSSTDGRYTEFFESEDPRILILMLFGHMEQMGLPQSVKIQREEHLRFYGATSFLESNGFSVLPEIQGGGTLLAAKSGGIYYNASAKLWGYNKGRRPDGTFKGWYALGPGIGAELIGGSNRHLGLASLGLRAAVVGFHLWAAVEGELLFGGGRLTLNSGKSEFSGNVLTGGFNVNGRLGWGWGAGSLLLGLGLLVENRPEIKSAKGARLSQEEGWFPAPLIKLGLDFDLWRLFD